MGKLRDLYSKVNIEWSNQIISFIGTILGIFIALNLQDWQDSRNEKASVEIARNSLREELRVNLSHLKGGKEWLTNFNGFTGAMVRYANSDTTIICSREAFDTLKAKYSGHFKDELVKRRWSGKVEAGYAFYIDAFLQPLLFDSWETVKSSGLLSKFEQKELKVFTQVYGDLRRNYLDVNEDDLMSYVWKDGEVEERNLNKKELLKITRKIQFTYNIKLQHLEPAYKELTSH